MSLLLLFNDAGSGLTPTAGLVSFASVEVPLVPTAGLVSFASLETPLLLTSGLVSFADFQAPSVGEQPSHGRHRWRVRR